MVVSPMAAHAMLTSSVTSTPAPPQPHTHGSEAHESPAAEQAEGPAQQAGEGEKGGLINVHA